MDIQKKSQEVIKCFHCGNETLMSKKGEYTWGSGGYEEFEFSYKYEMFACPVCHKITLRETYSDETMICYGAGDQMWWDKKKSILFPVGNIESNSVPPKIKEAYTAALRIKNIDKYVCLMALRRALELILKDKGAMKWGLKDKIEELAQKGLLPDTLKEASSLTKIFGDSAAHDKEIEIEQFDVECMSEFTGFIIQYLYVIPDKINMCKRRLDSETETGNDENF